jgi:phage terminase small subunit
MARHSQPDEVARLKGADKKNPNRYGKNTPRSDLPLGEPPEHLKGVAKNCWKEIALKSIPGVITLADGFILEIAASLLAEYRVAPLEFPAGKYVHLIGCLARLGLSPADRTKLNLPPEETENPYDHLDD